MSYILSKCSSHQWYSLLYEAEEKAEISLEPAIESYLLLLLQHYINKPEITEILASLEILKAIQQKSLQEQDKCLRDLGDQCLILAGLFPDYARKNHVNLEYFINIGQSSYFYLSISQSTELRTLFTSIYKNFVNIVDVLNKMNEIKIERQESKFLLNYTAPKAKNTKTAINLNSYILIQEKHILH